MNNERKTLEHDDFDWETRLTSERFWGNVRAKRWLDDQQDGGKNAQKEKGERNGFTED